MAQVSPIAIPKVIPKVNGAETHTLPCLQEDTPKTDGEGCGGVLLGQGGSEDLAIISLLDSPWIRLLRDGLRLCRACGKGRQSGSEAHGSLSLSLL